MARDRDRAINASRGRDALGHFASTGESPKNRRVTIRVTDSTYELLEFLCDDTEKSQAEVIRAALELYFERDTLAAQVCPHFRRTPEGADDPGMRD